MRKQDFCRSSGESLFLPLDIQNGGKKHDEK
jgi:hypothetical protein